MISYKVMKSELERLPKIIERYTKEDDLVQALEAKHVMETLHWILNSND